MKVIEELDARMAHWRPDVVRRVEQVLADLIALADVEAAAARDSAAWPRGFFERTAGALADTPLVREQPAEYDARRHMP